MTVHFRDLLVIKNCSDSKEILNQPQDIYDKLKAQADRVDASRLLKYMQKFSSIEAELKYSLNPRVLVEVASLECASLDDSNVKKN